jgi:sigma-B regulation protein RsbU (phosphoserine phosphatase)
MTIGDGLPEDIARIVRVCMALGSERDLDRLLALILREACALVHADRASLFLVDAHGGELVTRIAQGADEIRLPFGRGIAGTVAATGTLINIASAYDDPRFDSENDVRSGYQTRSILCLPLIDHHDAVVGVIQVLNRLNGLAFGHHDETLLAALCAQAAVSIATARLLHSELERQRLTRDLELARTIQLSLQPDQPPSIPGWRFAGFGRSCDQTGGDYYDFLPTTPGGCDVVIGDVSGHGIGSALLMNSARAALRAMHQPSADPGAIITRLNALLEHDMADDAFMSFVYARLGADGECGLVNAGHDTPLFYHPASGFVETDVGGLLLGLLPDMSYELTAVAPLAPGGVMVMFTDGIFEAQAPPSFEQFGVQRIRKVIAAHAVQGAAAVRDALVTAVDAWLGGHPPHDDMTVVVVERVVERVAEEAPALPPGRGGTP